MHRREPGEMKMTLTADQILSADDMGLKKLSVPEWGGDVYIRILTVGARDEYERMWIGKKETGIENFRSEYLARCLCNEKGELLFPGKADQIATKSGAIVSRLFDAALAHNSMTESEVVEMGKS
jgi:hypothetical protein